MQHIALCPYSIMTVRKYQMAFKNTPKYRGKVEKRKRKGKITKRKFSL